tara:strand:+ start:207 stop:404 length:198 start_codon:yes stop_codon:yes gene_type:complete
MQLENDVLAVQSNCFVTPSCPLPSLLISSVLVTATEAVACKSDATSGAGAVDPLFIYPSRNKGTQ